MVEQPLEQPPSEKTIRKRGKGRKSRRGATLGCLPDGSGAPMLRVGISLTRRRQFRVLQREGHEAAAETLTGGRGGDEP